MKNQNLTRVAAIASAIAFAGAAHATNPVVVNPGGGGNFTDLQSAISSFCIGGANAGETAPLMINIAAGTVLDDQIITLDSTKVGNGNLAGDLIIQTTVPGTKATLFLKQGLSGGSDGVYINQLTDVDITFRDLIIAPARRTVAESGVSDDLILIDQSATNAFSNTYAFYNCIVTDIRADGTPACTTRAGAFVDPIDNFDIFGASDALLKFFGDDGEPMNLILDNCVFYGNKGPASAGGAKTVQLATQGSDADTVTIHNCVFSFSRDTGIHLTDTGAGTGSSAKNGTYNILGDDVTAGPNNCTIIYKPQSETAGLGIYFENAPNAQINLDGVIIETIDTLDATAASNAIEHNYDLVTPAKLSVKNTIINTFGIAVTTTPGAADVFQNVTIHNHTSASDPATPGPLVDYPAINVVPATAGSAENMTFSNVIFSGPGIKFVEDFASESTGAYTGTINVDYAAYPTTGPDAITARGTLQIDGAHIVTADPQYVQKTDITLATYFDVGNSGAYGTAGPGGSALGGGNTATNDWMVYF